MDFKTTWIEVDLGALERNLGKIRKKLPKQTRLCGVVKADGYGHGALQIAKRMQNCNVDFLAVANLYEALELRREGIKGSLLVLGWIPVESIMEAIQEEISITVFDELNLQEISKSATLIGKRAKVHLKVETGMNRLGVAWNKIGPFAALANSLPNIFIEGTFSHLATADDLDLPWTQEQNNRFSEAIHEMRKNDIDPGICHLANSAGSLLQTGDPWDMVRIGIACYGAGTGVEAGLEPTLKLKTRIAQVKELLPGEAVGYGRCFQNDEVRRVAVLPIGYADGWGRILSGTSLRHKGKKYLLVGNICMDQCMIDVTNWSDCKQGDELTLIGQGGLTVQEVAQNSQTIDYEILVRLGKRIPRVYMD